MLKIRIILFFLMLITFCSFCFAQTEFGAGVGLSPWERRHKKKKIIKKPDNYIKAISKYFGMNVKDIAKLNYRGYGRNELIKLILISNYSNMDFNTIIRFRDKNLKLSRLCEKYRVDYKKILKDAEITRKIIDYEISAAKKTTHNYDVKNSSSN